MTGAINLVATLAEHWLYVPLMGMSLAIGAICSHALKSIQTHRPRHLRVLTVTACVAAVAALTARTIRRNQDWVNGFTLYSNTKKSAPYSARARNNLARQYLAAGNTDEALGELLEAERL